MGRKFLHNCQRQPQSQDQGPHPDLMSHRPGEADAQTPAPTGNSRPRHLDSTPATPAESCYCFFLRENEQPVHALLSLREKFTWKNHPIAINFSQVDAYQQLFTYKKKEDISAIILFFHQCHTDK